MSRKTKRGIGFEQLEHRWLLAADCSAIEMPQQLTAPSLPTRGLDDSTPLLGFEYSKPFATLAADDTIAEQTMFFAAADAGSTRGTAHDLGALESGQRSLRGTVGGSDRSDVIRFELSQSSQLNLRLEGMRADIDLYLYDASGRRLDASTNAGRRSERLQRTLDQGVYYAAMVPWSGAFSAYRLQLQVRGLQPSNPPADTSPPVDTSPPADTPPPAVESPSPTPQTPPQQPPATGGVNLVLADVPYYGGVNEWNLNLISAPEAWAAGISGAGVTVAVVDTGVDLDHPDLTSSLWVNAGEVAGNGIDDDGNGYVDDVHGWDFAGGDGRPEDSNGHGTHVAGTIAAGANGFGATGVAPEADIMAVRVLGNGGYGSSYDVAAGIRYAAENGADIINLSLGGGYSSVIQSAIQYAGQLGSLVIAAAGNESAGAPGYPARFSNQLNHVLSVGAHNSSSARAGFSNVVGGSGAVQVDAPGVGIYSTYVGGGYARLSGTSMAAPHVAGLAALALSANPQLTATQLRSAIAAASQRFVTGSDSLGGIDAATTIGGQSVAASSTAAAGASGEPTSVAARGMVAARGIARWFRSSGFGSALNATDDTAGSAATATASTPLPAADFANVRLSPSNESLPAAFPRVRATAESSAESMAESLALEDVDRFFAELESNDA